MKDDSATAPGADPADQPQSAIKPKPSPGLGMPPDVNPGMSGATAADEHERGASDSSTTNDRFAGGEAQ